MRWLKERDVHPMQQSFCLFGYSRRIFWIVCAMLFFLVAPELGLAKKMLRTHLSAGSYFDLQDGKQTNQRFALRQETRSKLYKKRYEIALISDVRLEWDTQTDFPSGDAYRVKPDSLFLEWQKSLFRIAAGFQTLSWGEAFGLPIMDVVNPVDFTDPPGSNMVQRKIPIAMVSAELIANDIYLQFLGTPFPRRSPLPRHKDGLPIVKVDHGEWGKDFEFGGRLGYLFASGLDVKLVYYHHWFRTPRFELGINSATGEPELREVALEVDLVGVSLSQAVYSWVFRFDAAHESGYLLPAHMEGLSPQEALQKQVGLSNRSRALLSVDTTTDSGQIFGFQLQAQHIGEPERELAGPESEAGGSVDRLDSQTHLWGGIQANFSAFERKLVLENFVIMGLGNADIWVRPQLQAYLTPRIRIEAEFNYVDGKSDGDTDIFQPRSDFQSGLTYRF